MRRLKVAAKAVCYYQLVDRATTPGNMHFTDVLRNFELQWSSLEDKIDADEPDVPKITRNLAVTRWSESFSDFLNQSYGVRKAPLAYVIRDDATVVVPGPALAHHQPHSNEHGSVEGELIARLSHTHPIFCDDNKMVYDYLGVATRSTIYAASIKPFQRTKNGRAAYQVLISQHAGEDKWEKELKQQETFMKTQVWKGNSNFSLEKFIKQHRTAYISMQQCSLHVTFQLPDEHTRVCYLIDSIQCSDPELQATLAAICADKTGPNAKRNHFENCVTFLLPVDPVSKKQKANNDGHGNVANISLASTSGKATGQKQHTGATGVELQYHMKQEYSTLTDEQK